MNYFKYSKYNSIKCEHTVGVVIAANKKEARKKVSNHYKTDNWDIEEVQFSEDDCIETFYG